MKLGYHYVGTCKHSDGIKSDYRIRPQKYSEVPPSHGSPTGGLLSPLLLRKRHSLIKKGNIPVCNKEKHT